MLHTTIEYRNKTYTIDLAEPIDISLPVGRMESPNAFYLSPPVYEVVEAGGFVGKVSRGGSCNCENIYFNPHGNGTHTEGAGHVSEGPVYITEVLKRFFFPARLITVRPQDGGEGMIISRQDIEPFLDKTEGMEAVLIRTLPNPESKRYENYSGAHAPYFSVEAIDCLNEAGILHILTDLPSLDWENDADLKAHKAFFGFPERWNMEKTVTEMIFVPDTVQDGIYWLNLQIASFESDASPSKPVIYRVKN